MANWPSCMPRRQSTSPFEWFVGMRYTRSGRCAARRHGRCGYSAFRRTIQTAISIAHPRDQGSQFAIGSPSYRGCAPALYNAGVSETAARVIVVAGALMQPHWVPPTELRARLARISGLADLGSTEVELPQPARALPQELAHDRWLRLQPGPSDAAIAPGALAAIRQLAPWLAPLRGSSGPSAEPSLDATVSGWLLEPVHFHLAKDHLVLVSGAAGSLGASEAQQLADAIRPLLAEEAFLLTVASPGLWLLHSGQLPLQLEAASSEAAAGRNVEGYLPAGSSARRYRRKMLQMLEEPPSHVVFVLATTDPQKVSDTIRSRTQHLRFHLLPPDVLAEHVRWVAADAGLDVSADAVDAAVTQGAGSARDTLSALELIANRRRRARRGIDVRRLRRGVHRPRSGPGVDGDGSPRQRRPRPPHDRRGPRQAPAQRVPLADGARPRAAPRRRRRSPRRPVASASVPPPSSPPSSGSARSSSSCATPPTRGCSSRSPSCSCAASATAATTSPGSSPGSPSSNAPRPPRRSTPAPVDPSTGRAKLGGRAQQPAERAPADAPTSAPPPAPQPVPARWRRRRHGGGDDLGVVWSDTSPPEPARPHPGAVRPGRGRRRGRRRGHAVGAEPHPPGEVRATGRRRRAGAARGHRASDHGALGVGGAGG